MKQKIYCAVARYFQGNADKVGTPHIISAHITKVGAEESARREYDEMKACSNTTFAEWSEFGGVRGLVRNDIGISCSIYVKECEVEI